MSGSGNTAAGSMAVPRIAIGGFMLESNGHAPVATRDQFEAYGIFEGPPLLAELARPAPRAPTCLSGFCTAMDAGRAWASVPLYSASAGASGPVDQAYFDEVVARMSALLRAAMPVDGVYLSLHGAATATGDFDPDGALLEAVRTIIGSDVPLIATFDLHANISLRMAKAADMLIGYRTNPHVDMLERGAEAAACMQAMLGGMRPRCGFVKLPMIPPSTSQNTGFGPFKDAIEYGQAKLDHEIMNVSIASGFTSGDTPKNGLSVLVYARHSQQAADAAARDLASFIWASRERWQVNLTSLADAVAMAKACGEGAREPLLFADVADNPGGGGRGNTMYILRAFVEAGVRGCAVGIIFDPALAAEAHALGEGARFRAGFNRNETQEFSEPFAANAVVEKLSDGTIVGRRGISAGRTITLGPTALLRIGGIQVAVVSQRRQLADPAVVEHLGIDLATVRSLVVKSRGHFRAGFDEFFPRERIVEVDVPGLTTVVLSRVPWRHVKRPIWPLDAGVEWRAE
jgi:microcystin degradation protein MlrC